MTVVSGSIAAVDMEPTDGTLTAWSERLRPGGTVMVTSERRQVPIVAGEFSVDLVPGPTEMVISASGINHPLTVNVPSDVDEVDFQDLVGAEFVWEPEVVQAAQQAAAESRRQADRSESEADRAEVAADRVGSAERVLEAETNSAASATAAATSAGASAVSASASADSAGAAEQSAGEASDSAGAAQQSASAAAGAEERATERASSAASSASNAWSARQDAVTARDDARVSRTAAEAAQGAAEEARDDAQAAQAGAEASATSAAQAITNAVTEVTSITSGHADRAETAAGEALSSKNAAKASADAAAASAESAADIALGSIPDATATTKGMITMKGDLAGSGANPKVPGLALVAPGASLPLVPPGEGWSNATGTPAMVGHHMDAWHFDGTWLRPPEWLGQVHITVDWCGRSSVVLRGERQDASVTTLATIPALDPEEHRQVTVLVDLSVTPRVAVAGTWTAEDIDAECAVSLLVRPLPEHSHNPGQVEGLDQLLGSKVEGNDPRLSDSRTPRTHSHPVSQVTGLQAALDGKADGGDLVALQGVVAARPAMWIWDGVGEWSAPEGASAIDTVLNLDSGEVHAITEVE